MGQRAGKFTAMHLGAIVFMILTKGAAGGSIVFSDPFATDKRVAPQADRPWQSIEPRPQVSTTSLPEGVLAELSGTVSLAKLTDLALRLNPKTRQAWLQARAEAATLGVEEADRWPQLNAQFSGRLARVISNTTGLPANPSMQSQYGPNISLSYVLYDFGQRAANIEAAKFRVLAANLSQNRVLQEVAFGVEQAYYRIVALQYLVRASRESLKNFETALDATKRRRNSGLATVADEYRAETQVGQSQLVLSRNEGELSKSRGQLANAVGLPVNFPLKLQAVSGTPPVARITQSMDALLEKAKSNRPDLAAAEARARAAKATALAVSRAGLPSLEFTTNYGRVLFTDQRPGQDVYQFGLSLRIPLFSGFRDTYSSRRAEAVAEQAETIRDQLLNQAELDVWQAYFDLQTAASAVASTASLVKSATESAAAAAARYKAGVGTLLDLITAQLDETNAHVQRIQSYLDWYTALARLNFALGASDPVMRGAKQQ